MNIEVAIRLTRIVHASSVAWLPVKRAVSVEKLIASVILMKCIGVLSILALKLEMMVAVEPLNRFFLHILHFSFLFQT